LSPQDVLRESPSPCIPQRNYSRVVIHPAFFLCPWTDGTPEMQEQFPAMSMDGRYAGNAGAISGDIHGRTVRRKCRSNFRHPWATIAPKNAGAIFGKR